MKAIGSTKPRLRFKDVQGRDYPDWKSSLLGIIATIVMGQSPDSSKYNDERIGLPLIQGNADIRDRKSNPRRFTADITKRCIPDDTLMSVRAPVGEVARAVHHACIGRGVALLRAKESLTKQEFLYYFLLRFEPRWRKYSQGSTFEAVNSHDIQDLQVGLPTLAEQQKIADFLSAVDQKIEQLERKRELLEHYKKGLMQKLFSQEWRFKDDNGNKFPEWQTKCLVDLGIVITGKTPSTTNKALWGGELLFITPTDIDDRSKYQYKTARNIKPSKGVSILPSHSIVYSCIASIGKITMTVRPSTTNQQINSIIPHESISSNFVYYLLVWNTPRIKATRACNTLPIINKTEFQNIIVNVPNSSEQRKIADFLSAVDKKIEHLNNQIELSSTFKQGLLQQLFV